MNINDWLNKLVQIPGRLTSIAIERVVCGAEEVWDDDLNKRQSELNARFKAITDQEQIAIDGGTATIASSPEDIEIGSGSIVTANAVAGYYADFMKGTSDTVELDEDFTVDDPVAPGQQRTIMFINDTESEITVTVPNTTYRTPDGENIVFDVPVGGYGEVSLFNVDGIIFARGC